MADGITPPLRASTAPGIRALHDAKLLAGKTCDHSRGWSARFSADCCDYVLYRQASACFLYRGRPTSSTSRCALPNASDAKLAKNVWMMMGGGEIIRVLHGRGRAELTIHITVCHPSSGKAFPFLHRGIVSADPCAWQYNNFRTASFSCTRGYTVKSEQGHTGGCQGHAEEAAKLLAIPTSSRKTVNASGWLADPSLE